MIAQPSNFVEIKVVTWNKDSHGLFDYESKSIVISKHQINQPSKIFRSGENDIKLIDEKEVDQISQSETGEPQYLTSIKQQHIGDSNYYTLDPTPLIPSIVTKPYQTPLEDSLSKQSFQNFLIVRSLQNQDGQQKGYSLEVGDILKLGRIEYLVVEIRDQENNIKSVKDSQQSELRPIKCVVESEQMEIQGAVQQMCKICLMQDNTDQNFLISPCECKGSCLYVHFLCLKQWIESKIQKKPNGSTISYNWQQSQCELCQAALPKRITGKNNNNYDLIDIQRPSCPYIILESLAKEKASEQKVSQSLFLICGTDETIQLGRGHSCVVRISDISVSREHAFIQYIEGKFMIIDNNSQFGTLIQLTKPREITREKIAIQVGRTVITFVVQSPQPQNTVNSNAPVIVDPTKNRTNPPTYQ